MADPTAIVSANLSYEADGNSQTLVIKNAEPLVLGALIALNTSTGLVEFADDIANTLPCGIAVAQPGSTLTGNGSSVTVTVRGGIVIKDVTVATVASVGDVGKLCYSTDGQLLTLTRPTNGQPCGIVVSWKTGTTCSVYLFSLAESKIYQAANASIDAVSAAISTTAGAADENKLVKTTAGGIIDSTFLPNAVLDADLISSTLGGADAGKPIKTDVNGVIADSFLLGAVIKTNMRKSFGTFSTSVLEGGAVTLHTEVSDEKYTINSLHMIPRGVDAALIAGAQTLTLAIDGTDTTGGILSIGFGNLDTAGDIGTVVNAAAITAANVVVISAVVTLRVIAGGTGFTAGKLGFFEVYALCTNNT